MSYIQLESLVNSIRAEPTDAIARSRELGEPRSFKEIENLSKQVVIYFDFIFPEKYKVYDEYVWYPVINIVNKFRNIIEYSKSLSISDPTFEDGRRELIGNAYEEYARYVSFIQGVVSVSQYNKIEDLAIGLNNLKSKIEEDIDGLEIKTDASLLNRINKFDSDSQSVFDEYKEKLNSIDAMMESVKVKSERLFAESEAQHFSLTSNNFNRSSIFWLISTIVVSAVAIAMATIMMNSATGGFIRKLTQNELIVYVSTKAFIFSIICYILSKCMRNYFAAKHNYSVNVHRSNAILSYRALHEITKESTKRDEILSAVANAVFSPQDSAYVKASSGNDVPTAIINSFAGGVKEHSS